MKLHFASALLGGLLLASAATAQTPGVAGTYLVDYDSQIRMAPGGGPEVTGRSKAKLTLEVRGDSVFGTWQAIDDGNPRPPRKLKGTIRQDTIRVAAEPTEVTVNINGQPQTVVITQEFTATVSGNQISGRIESPSPMPGTPPIRRSFNGPKESDRLGVCESGHI